MEYELTVQVKDNPLLRRSFMDLARQVFGLSFDKWYQGGYWTGRYIPYVLADAGRVVANVSVNVMDMRCQGKARRFVQLGTVMTAPELRGRALARRLMERVMRDWSGACDGMYLFANHTVLDFYPRFGFERRYEHRFFTVPGAEGPAFERLDMGRAEHRAILGRCYGKSNRFSALAMEDNWGLIMFYLTDFLKDCVYYSPALDTVCVWGENEGAPTCYDLFGEAPLPLERILAGLPGAAGRRVALGFTPLAREGLRVQTERALDEDDALFVLGGAKELFEGGRRAMFPALSHA